MTINLLCQNSEIRDHYWNTRHFFFFFLRKCEWNNRLSSTVIKVIEQKQPWLQKYQNTLHKKCFSVKITKHTLSSKLQHIFFFCHNTVNQVPHYTIHCSWYIALGWGTIKQVAEGSRQSVCWHVNIKNIIIWGTFWPSCQTDNHTAIYTLLGFKW